MPEFFFGFILWSFWIIRWICMAVSNKLVGLKLFLTKDHHYQVFVRQWVWLIIWIWPSLSDCMLSAYWFRTNSMIFIIGTGILRICCLSMIYWNPPLCRHILETILNIYWVKFATMFLLLSKQKHLRCVSHLGMQIINFCCLFCSLLNVVWHSLRAVCNPLSIPFSFLLMR